MVGVRIRVMPMVAVLMIMPMIMVMMVMSMMVMSMMGMFMFGLQGGINFPGADTLNMMMVAGLGQTDFVLES